MVRLAWKPDRTPPELQDGLAALAESFPICPSSAADAMDLVFVPGGDEGRLEIRCSGREAEISYDQPARAWRAIGALLADLPKPGEPHVEQTPFRSLGVMIDCSRNAVMKPDTLRAWMRRLALFGYNQLMLYTEDTYELPGEEYFGYLRGRYTAEDLRGLDAFAARLGIEMVGCIQTLGHLEQLLKWSAYRDIKDTPSVLLVDHDRTYDLIEKMIVQYASNLRSRRLHIGMDETHDLGRGRFMDRFGYQRGYDIFNRHLARVVDICKRHGVLPMIWSDMFFRMGSATGSYYDPASVIPDDVRRAIPRDVTLVYWDYEHDQSSFYADWIARHRDLGFEPVMASGIWTWGGHLWYGHERTDANLPPCVRACKESGLKEIFFTMWGDDGAYCEYDSAWAGIAQAAELSFGDDPHDLAARFAALCGADYDTVIQTSAIQKRVRAGSLLWDDPLLRIYWKNERIQSPDIWRRVVRDFNGILRRLGATSRQTEPVDFDHLATVVRFLRDKVKLGLALDAAYASRDAEALEKVRIAAARMPRRIDAALGTFRRQWHRRNRPQGFETLQLRLGGQQQRWRELAMRLDELIRGEIPDIPELDEQPSGELTIHSRWRDVSAGGIK